MEELKTLGKFVASAALAVSYVTPLAAITVPATAVAVGAGAVTTAAGYAFGSEKTKEVGITILEVATGGMEMDTTGKASLNKTLECCDTCSRKK